MDIFTLFYVEASLLFLFSLTMLAGSIGRSGKSGSYWFAASNFCGGVGLLLHCAINGPALLNVVLANLFTFVELALLNKAVAEFVSLGRRVWFYLLALSVLMTLATIRYTLWPEDHNLRVAFISVVAIATAACSATLLLRSLRNGAKTSTIVMGVLFSLYATTNTVRLLSVWTSPHQSFFHIWLDRTIIAALSFCFLWMTTTRLCDSLELLAGTDALTGLLNRRAVEHETARVFTRSRERHDSIAALMLDIDCFKQINDGYGHQAGDLALCAVADCLRNTMRASDLIARLGGDEFLVIMPNADANAAQFAADRIQTKLAELRVACDTGEFGLRASIGIISIDSGNLTLDYLLELGDRALYVAKATSHRETSGLPQFVH